MFPFGRRLSLVSPASPESVLMRLGRNVTAVATAGVPFAGRVAADRFRIHPVWTWTPRGSSSPETGLAFRVPLCFVDGAVSPAVDGSRIDVRVRLSWPLPLVLLCWAAAYVNGLRNRTFGSDDLTVILPMALFVFGICVPLVLNVVVRGSVQELRRVTMAEPGAVNRLT